MRLIDADALLEHFCSACGRDKKFCNICEDKEDIMAQPTIIPDTNEAWSELFGDKVKRISYTATDGERVTLAPIRHGQWIREFHERYFHCSECYNDAVCDDYIVSCETLHYCPNCGAKMDKE